MHVRASAPVCNQLVQRALMLRQALPAAFCGGARCPVGAVMGFKKIDRGNPRRAIKLAALRAALVTVLIGTPAVAHDNGQFGDVPPQVREWFHNVRSAKGIPCCDIADGHRTDFDMRQNLYWVPIDGNWMPVPPDAVLKNAGNPTGSAVVWYSNYGGQVIIRCFVPGGGA